MDKAILYLDTCVLLDMFRDPTRNDIRIHEHESSRVLLEIVMTGGKIESCIGAQVEREFHENVGKVQCEAERKLKALAQKVGKLDHLASLHGSRGKADIRHWAGHIERSRSFAERWIQAGSIIQPPVDIEVRAFRRASAHRTPARKGSASSLSDCVVLETCLEHLRVLRDNGRVAPAVFVSSKTRDYAAQDRTRIRDDVEDEFRSLNLRYAPNMGAARGLLGL